MFPIASSAYLNVDLNDYNPVLVSTKHRTRFRYGDHFGSRYTSAQATCPATNIFNSEFNMVRLVLAA